MKFVLIGVISLFSIMGTIFISAFIIGLVKSIFVTYRVNKDSNACVAKNTQECSGDVHNCIKSK